MMSRMPQVTARELIRFLKAKGFVEDRQSGSHLKRYIWTPDSIQREVFFFERNDRGLYGSLRSAGKQSDVLLNDERGGHYV